MTNKKKSNPKTENFNEKGLFSTHLDNLVKSNKSEEKKNVSHLHCSSVCAHLDMHTIFVLSLKNKNDLNLTAQSKFNN